MEHVKPLRDALDWLAGKPDEIAAHAATWRNVSASASEAHQQYAAAIQMQTAEWLGASGDAYRAHAGEQLAAVDGIATVTNAISYAVEGAGLLVGLVREIVRDLIAQFVATLAVRLPQWLAEEGVTLGLATPVVAAQVATLVARWVNRIQHFIRALLNSLRRLNGKLDELAGILARLKQLLGRLHRTDPVAASASHSESSSGNVSAEGAGDGLFREGDGIVRNGQRLLMSRENVLAVAEKFGIDMSGVRFSLDKVRRGSGPGKEFYGVTMPNGDIKLARDAFMDEEQPARTLAHERFHLDELRGGMDFPWKEADRAAYEVRAYAHEEQWWQSKKHLLDQE
ncbi:WXG100 family type VII secretion target [Actinoplanes couchii]|uniref:Tox-MPTase4 domain-containing protein n=1 Tax=Actinoplanes couchii TaxID=403638 RepID=A0ABQ3XEC9_9ACTN|nr:hypothetical protein [Actinoplanes couchii]MDR6319720.1 hypothetical protein [Actinoplanes couchii]GID56854.1 hypothetical protein Aco03nite_052580 [Actinoplanes couchii]